MDISGISKISSSNVVSVNPNQLETYADSITLKNLATGDLVREDIRDEDALKRHQAGRANPQRQRQDRFAIRTHGFRQADDD